MQDAATLVDPPYFSQDWVRNCVFCSKKWSYSETTGVRLTQELAAQIRQMAPKGVSHILLTHDDFAPWLQENGQKQENSFFGQWALYPFGKFSYHDGSLDDAKDGDLKTS